MKQLDLVIHNETGLHARPAKTFVGVAKQFKSKIKIAHGKREVNAKSLISVLTLGVRHEGEIRISIEGEDEDEASVALKQAVLDGLGEKINVPASANGAESGHAEAAPSEHVVSTASQNGAQKNAQAEASENVVVGIAASAGIAIAPLFQLVRREMVVGDKFTGVVSETQMLSKALAEARTEIHQLVAETASRTGSAEAEIFEAHLELLDDPELIEEVQSEIENQVSAARAWQTQINARAELLAGLDDPLLAARSADMRDVGERVLGIITGQKQDAIAWPESPIILLADDLTPSDTVALDKDKVLGFCTASGGPNAHAAILARALGLPALVGAGDRLLTLKDGENAILDGEAGTLTLQPSAELIAAAWHRQRDLTERRAKAAARASESAITRDGHHVEIVANAGSLSDAKLAMQSGAEGIGLLRSEFLFLERDDAPTEDEQFIVYRDIVSAMEKQPVIVRTLDIGGDKQVPYLDMPHEENPFLGVRGIRLCLERPELFMPQLRAIVRSAEFGKVRIMFPMVSALSELLAAKKMVADVCAEMKVPMVEVGIMIEVPSAALMADIFAPHIDFFSIGTNDLTQYTLAIDRQHPTLATQADGLNPAVLRLIARTAEAAHAAGKWVGVCGELGADRQAVPILLGLGVDELSVSAPAIPTVKAQIRELNLSDSKALAQKALTCASSSDVRQLTN